MYLSSIYVSIIYLNTSITLEYLTKDSEKFMKKKMLFRGIKEGLNKWRYVIFLAQYCTNDISSQVDLYAQYN